MAAWINPSDVKNVAGAMKQTTLPRRRPEYRSVSMDLANPTAAATANTASATAMSGGVSPPPSYGSNALAPLEYALFRDGLTSSWQLDLFGRVRRAVEAADAETLAAIENRHGVALAALTELAQSYMQLRGTQNRLEIAKRNLRLADENVELVNTRFGSGVATSLDLARAQRATIAATLPPLRNQEAEFINSIGLLLGEAPRALEAELRRSRMLLRMPRRVPVGLPGTLVRRRPDVREAEGTSVKPRHRRASRWRASTLT
jgi:outer membrane protein TolC